MPAPDGLEGGPCVLDDAHAGKHRNMGGRRWVGYSPESLEAAAAEADAWAAQLPEVTRALELDSEPLPVDDAELLEAARAVTPRTAAIADAYAARQAARGDHEELEDLEAGGDSPGDTGDTPGDTPENPENPADTGDNRADTRDTAGEETDGTGRLTDENRRPALRGGQPVWDWTVIRTRYIEGVPTEGGGFDWPTHPDLVREFGIPLNTLRARSANEGWTQQRARFQAAYERHRFEERAKERAKAAASLDDAALKAAETGLRLCSAKLLELAQRAQARRAATVGDGTPDSGIDAEEQRRLATAVELWHKIGLRAVGDPETHRIELTGAGGRPIEVAAELRRDDPSRLTAVLAVFDRAGLGDVLASQAAAARGGGDVVAGEVEARR